MNEGSKIQNPKSKIACVFPGQGSQTVGMGKDLCDAFQSAREVFEEADQALGFSLSEICFNGPEEALALTANTQPAILTTSVAAFRVMMSEGFPAPDFVAGHSLGEYSALVAAGSLSFWDAVRVVRKRGEYMQAAVPVGDGAMAAILGLPIDQVEAGCREAAQGEVCSPANINSSAQAVIAGNTAAVERACEILRAHGAKRAIKLNVSAPFHCALMLPAQESLERDLELIEFNDLAFPIVENVSAALNADGARARRALTLQVPSPVRWSESVATLIENGVEDFIEVGAGKVLTGLLRQINRDARGLNVEDSESLKKSSESLKKSLESLGNFRASAGNPD